MTYTMFSDLLGTPVAFANGVITDLKKHVEVQKTVWKLIHLNKIVQLTNLVMFSIKTDFQIYNFIWSFYVRTNICTE